MAVLRLSWIQRQIARNPDMPTPALSTPAAADAPMPDRSAPETERMREVYAALRRAARRRRRQGRSPDTLCTTALVHEAWMRVQASASAAVRDDDHLIAVCARAMRHVLVDYCRSQAAAKRGGGWLRDDGEVDPGAPADPAALIALDQALHEIESHDPRLARVIELRVFAGLEPVEIGGLLGVDVRTIQRDWLRAKAWLADALG
jgi:RNA polymerase sigma factor (TIGR02999 family)